MAVATTTYAIAPEDGWTLIGTNPNSLTARALHGNWMVYVGTSLPANSVNGLPMMGEDIFTIGTIVGNVYVRVLDNVGNNNKASVVVINT